MEDVPKIETEQYQILVYSGSSNGLTSPMQNHTPLTLVDFRIKNNHTVSQELPSSYGGLIYVLNGAVEVAGKTVEAGWLDKAKEREESAITFTSKSDDTRFILYAAQAHKAPVISHGPFIGDTIEDITRLYKEYRSGEMPHLNDLPDAQKIDYSETSLDK